MSTTASPTTAASTHALQCMEIWSGNAKTQNAISVPGIDAWIYSEPFEGEARGGDIHYVSLCGWGRLSRFAIADVAGHGSTVDTLATRLRKLMRKYIKTLDQTRLARSLNHEFLEFAQAGQFATALLTTYYAPTDDLIICNIGHPRPLWYRSQAQTWERLHQDMPQRAEQVRNLPLGIIEPTDYAQFAVRLTKGDLILIYTDSLVESRNAKGEQLGEDGLLDSARRLDAGDPMSFNAKLLDAVAAYRGGAPPEDDQTLLVLHHNAADPPQQSLGEKIRVMGKVFGLIDV